MTFSSICSNDTILFKQQYEKLLAEFLFELHKLEIPEMATQWIKQMSDYNTLGGKMNRGLSVLESARILHETDLSREQLVQLCALAWGIEWLQASFLIGDDIMDSGKLRRGKPCWYTIKRVGMIAINDCFVLHSIIFKTLRNHFNARPKVYMEIVELFNDIKMKTEVGQLMDLLTCPSSGSRESLFENFTMANYRKIVVFKTAFYSFHLPVLSAITALELTHDHSVLELFKDALLSLGEYFQIQDDYLDCYGDPSVMGKVGTDIQEGKCTWLIVSALSSPNLAIKQRRKLAENYGLDSIESCNIVKAIYDELGLCKLFEKFEAEFEFGITQKIQKIKAMEPGLAQVLESLLGRILYRRK